MWNSPGKNTGMGCHFLLQMVKNLFDPWVQKIPQRRKWQPTPVFLPGESHGQRSLVGYSPQGRKESDMTERLHFHFSLSLSKLIYGFNTILIKILAGVFAEMDKPILKFTWKKIKFTWKWKGFKAGKIILKKKKVRRLTLPYFKTSNKASGIKTIWYWHKDRLFN